MLLGDLGGFEGCSKEDCCGGQCPRSGEKMGEIQQEGLRVPTRTVSWREKIDALGQIQFSVSAAKKASELGRVSGGGGGRLPKFYFLLSSHSPDAQRKSTARQAFGSSLPFRSSPHPSRGLRGTTSTG